MKENTMKTALWICLGFLCVPLTGLHAEEVRLASVFTDHTVLQRDRPAPVWGWADPGEEVTVEFAGQRKSVKADPNGRWLVRLDPMPASAKGRKLVVRSANGRRLFKVTDVVVGDVWLCSGQSNMHFSMSGVENSQEEIASADNPELRFFRVGHQFGQCPKADVTGAWEPVSPRTAAKCSAVAYYFGRSLQQKLNVPIGLLVSSVGGTRIETWSRPETLDQLGVARGLVDRWKGVSPEEFEQIDATYQAFQHQRDRVHPQQVAAAKSQGLPAPPAPQQPRVRCHDCPGALHFGMIVPLHPFAFRGAIWYQGESNVGNPGGYEKLQPALIEEWRRAWGVEFPFLFVQLAPHVSASPKFRESQHRIWQSTPLTAMVATLDVGDANNIHPIRKRPVGERLALAALALSYGEPVEYRGPDFKSMSVEGERAVVRFTHVAEGLSAKGGSLMGFTIAGADKKFFPAEARIEGKDTVVVTSPKAPQPVAVRYAWAAVPECNLFSSAGLPAYPFRTDERP